VVANFEPDKFGAFFYFEAKHFRMIDDYGRMLSRDKGKKMSDSFSFSFFLSECPIFVRLWWRMNYNEEKLSRLHFCFCIFSFMSPSFFIIEIKRNFDRKNLWKYQKNPSISQKGVPPQDPYFLKNGQINRVTKFSSTSRPTESDSEKKLVTTLDSRRGNCIWNCMEMNRSLFLFTQFQMQWAITD